jgi:hypothetical protein
MEKRQLTRNDFEAARAKIFHMILFAMAWVMIGEYCIHFRDYAAAGGIVLVSVVLLGLQTIKLYDLESELPAPLGEMVGEAGHRRKRFRLNVTIFIFEGAAIMATWMILLREGRTDWLVPGFALIAGLHFIPLAMVSHLSSYYLLGVWICLLALIGYLLPGWGALPVAGSNALIAYGCAAGAIADALSVVSGIKKKISWKRRSRSN